MKIHQMYQRTLSEVKEEIRSLEVELTFWSVVRVLAGRDTFLDAEILKRQSRADALKWVLGWK